MGKICYRWGFTGIKWKDANWTWSECQLVQDIVNVLGGAAAPGQRYEVEDLWQRNKEKKKRLIRLICKVKGETFDETKEHREDIKITADEIKMVIKAVLDIDVDVNLKE